MKEQQRILVAEDNAIAARVLTSLLEGHDYQVRAVEDGAEALTMARAWPPDLVISDILMPELDGFGLCRELKRDPGLQDVPVVFYSSTFTSDEDRRLATALGASRFLTKSMSNEQVLQTVAEVLQEHESVPEAVPAMMPREVERLYHERLVNKLQQKVAQAEASEARFRQVVEMVPDMLVTLRVPDYAPLFVSPAAHHLLGYTPDELMAEPELWRRRVAPDDIPAALQLLDEVVATRREQRVELRFHHRDDGSERWFEVRLAPQVGADERVQSVFGVLSDITLRREAEHLAEEKMRELATLMGNLPGMAYRCRNDQLWSMQFVSEGARTLTGYSPEELHNNARISYQELIHPDDRTRVWATVQTALEERRQFQITYRLRTASGEERWVWELGTGVWRGDGSLRALEGFVTDVTEQKLADVALQRINRALRTLSTCNEALVRAASEEELLQQVSDAIVEIGGYRMVWVGYAEPGSAHTMRPVAHAGVEEGFLDEVAFGWGDDVSGHTPVGMAVRLGQPILATELAADMPAPWQEVGHRHGYRDCLALPLQVQGETIGALVIHAAEVEAFDREAMELLEQLAGDLSYGIAARRLETKQAMSAERLQRALLETVRSIALTIEKRDPYTAGHQQRVATLAMAIAAEMGLDEDRIQGIQMGSLVHDIGKIYVPSEILNRPGRLSDVEFGIIKSHPEVGHDIISAVEFPWPVAQMIVQHHERLDGSGYPYGLKGEAIVLEARILAVADVVEAMASHRPYRPGLGIEVALTEIERGRGSGYDEAAVDACLRLFRDKGFQLEGL